MDHTGYIKKTRKMPEAVLKYIIKECQEVIELQKDFNPNIGYYTDEIHYCSMELKCRQDIEQGKKDHGKKGINRHCNEGMGTTPEEIRKAYCA